jgi:hypothetical protein
VRVERRGAVRADDSQVLDAIVGRNAVDVIEDQRHLLAAPDRPLRAQLALGLLDACLVKPFLEVRPRERRLLDKDVVERDCPAPTATPPAGVGIEVVGRHAPARERSLERAVIATRVA